MFLALILNQNRRRKDIPFSCTLSKQIIIVKQFFIMARQPLWAYGSEIVEVSGSHSVRQTHHTR